MAEKGSKKCAVCGTFVSAESMDYGEGEWSRSGKFFCRDCYEGGIDDASTLVRFDADGDKCVTKFDEDFNYWSEDGYDGEDYPEPIVGQHYVRTDAWRGYSDFTLAEGFVKLAGGWVTGFPDSSVSRKFDVAEFYQALTTGELTPPADLYWLFAHTSNIFSTACDVICRSEDREVLEKWMADNGESVEALYEQLG